jgi:hypothetical protein
MAMKIKELCQECEQHVNEICEKETDIRILETTLKALNEGQKTLGVLRGKIIRKAGKINNRK